MLIGNQAIINRRSIVSLRVDLDMLIESTRPRWQLHRRRLSRLSLSILVVKQEVNDAFTLISLREASQLWIEQFDTEPDVVVWSARVVQQERVYGQELVIGNLSTLVARCDSQGTEDDMSKQLLCRSQYL